MKKLLVLVSLTLLVSCNQMKSNLKSDQAKVSYALGQQIGTSLKNQEMDVDVAALAMGVNDVIKGNKSGLTPEEMNQALMKNQQARLEKMKTASDKTKSEGKAWLEENKSKEGVKVTASGLQYKIIKDGTGASPKDGDTVTVNYIGKLVNGSEFDSSVKRGQPAEFPVNGVIPGWTEALKLMKKGSKWELAIPSELAYGDMGRPPVIPGGSVLLFEVELLDFKKSKK
ncbi:MAG: FKBP-type peptidyl-prolyl cis-trans isomerase [Oligoflexia bacterium]|nr:FKBP-type peptidyl-prolyl cis-trans isomerase [Oligoflexia bacterium]